MTCKFSKERNLFGIGFELEIFLLETLCSATRDIPDKSSGNNYQTNLID